MASNTGTIKRNTRSSSKPPTEQNKLLEGLSPFHENNSAPSSSNSEMTTSSFRPGDESNLSPIRESNFGPEQVNMDLVKSRPLLARTPIDILKQQVIPAPAKPPISNNPLNDTLGIGPLNTSGESDSIQAPSYSSLSGAGATFINNENIQTIRNTNIDNQNKTQNTLDTVRNDLKAYVNLAVVNAFSAYAESMKSEITENIKQVMKDNLISFLGDINVATGPLRQKENEPKTTAQRQEPQRQQPQSNLQQEQ